MSIEGLSEKTILNARRCVSVRNRHSGLTFKREDMSAMDWAMLFDRAFRNPDEFESNYDAELAKDVTAAYKYTEEELRPKTLRDLKSIALERGATGENKNELIKNIVAAQG